MQRLLSRNFVSRKLQADVQSLMQRNSPVVRLQAACRGIASRTTAVPLVPRDHPSTLVLATTIRYPSAVIPSKHAMIHRELVRQFGGADTSYQQHEQYHIYPVESDQDEVEKANPAEAFTIPASDLESMDAFVLSVNEQHPLGKQIIIWNSSENSFEALEDIEQVRREQDRAGKVYLQENFLANDNSAGNNKSPTSVKDLDPVRDVMEITIMNVTSRLMILGWERDTGSSNILVKAYGGERRSARDLVLELAEDDRELQKYILNNIGALEHIAKSIHYDFIWNHPDLPYEDEMEKILPKQPMF